MKIVKTVKMRELERRADASGNTYSTMMEHAGTLTARAAIERWPVGGSRVLVLVGPGNNGGDGLVCARALHDAGAHVLLYLWKREPDEQDVNFRLCRERGIQFSRAEDDQGLAQLKQETGRSDLIVDAFLGTGLTRPLEGLLKNVLETVGAEVSQTRAKTSPLLSPSRPTSHPITSPTVLAVDLPTGLNSDTGALDPAAVDADLTVTFAFPKIGQYIFPGAKAVGELVVADIGIPPEWADDVRLDVMTPPEVARQLPARPRDSNKGTYGKTMLAVGSTQFTGAPTYAAMAAGRVGAGLVTVAVPRTVYPIISGKLNEATFLPVPDNGGDWSPRAVSPLLRGVEDYESLLIGCGFGRADSTRLFVSRLLGPSARKRPLPNLVIDADALNILAESGAWWKQANLSAPPVLTPHPGEMARLTGTSIQAVQRDRVAMATHHAKEWNAVVVLKGAFTIVAGPAGRETLIPFASAALATAGTGDVLAGAIAGFLAQYRAHSIKSGHTTPAAAAEDAYRSAVCGAYIHGLAGTMAGDEIGDAGVVAGDLVPRLPSAIRLVAGKLRVAGEAT